MVAALERDSSALSVTVKILNYQDFDKTDAKNLAYYFII